MEWRTEPGQERRMLGAQCRGGVPWRRTDPHDWCDVRCVRRGGRAARRGGRGAAGAARRGAARRGAAPRFCPAALSLRCCSAPRCVRPSRVSSPCCRASCRHLAHRKLVSELGAALSLMHPTRQSDALDLLASMQNLVRSTVRNALHTRNTTLGITIRLSVSRSGRSPWGAPR